MLQPQDAADVDGRDAAIAITSGESVSRSASPRIDNLLLPPPPNQKKRTPFTARLAMLVPVWYVGSIAHSTPAGREHRPAGSSVFLREGLPCWCRADHPRSPKRGPPWIESSDGFNLDDGLANSRQTSARSAITASPKYSTARHSTAEY